MALQVVLTSTGEDVLCLYQSGQLNQVLCGEAVGVQSLSASLNAISVWDVGVKTSRVTSRVSGCIVPSPCSLVRKWVVSLR